VNTKTDPLLVRDKGSITGTILSDVDRGESVKCIGLSTSKEDGEWMKAKTNSGQEGFMKKEYLATTAPTAISGSGASKPSASQAVAGATGICIKAVYDKQVPQGKPSGGCASLEGTPHKGAFGGTHEGQTLVGCYEEKTALILYGCKCTVKRTETQAVDPGKSCPPGFKPR
jgi:hypothetical protein